MLRLATLLAAVLVAAGCGTGSPSAKPASTAAFPTPSAGPTATAAPTLGPTAPGPVDCSTAGTSQADIVLEAPIGFETVDLEQDPLESPVPVDPAEAPIVTTIVGGVELTADLAVGRGLETSTVIDTVVADFVPFGTSSTLPVAATFSGAVAVLRLPDQRVDGQLRISLTWTTECGTGGGSGTIALTVVPSSVTVGCPRSADGLADALAPLASARVTIGTLTAPLTLVAWSGRWISGDGTIDVEQFEGWDDARAVVAAPEAPIVFRESIDDLALVTLSASIYRHADVVEYLAAGSVDALATYGFVRRNANANGRANIPAPLEPGRYVMEVAASWQTSCLSVETYSVVSLEVR